MWKIIPISLLQSLLLAVGQLFFKLALDKSAPYEGFKKFWGSLKHDWYLWHGCGILLIGATVLWAYILRHFPFSVAYPLSCISFLFGMLLGAWFLGEELSFNKLLGMAIIMVGAFVLAK